MPRSHSICVVKGSPSMRGHTSKRSPSSCILSPFPFLITSVSFVYRPPASSGYLYHDFTDEGSRGTRDEVNWPDAVGKALFILSPLREVTVYISRQFSARRPEFNFLQTQHVIEFVKLIDLLKNLCFLNCISIISHIQFPSYLLITRPCM